MGLIFLGLNCLTISKLNSCVKKSNFWAVSGLVVTLWALFSSLLCPLVFSFVLHFFIFPFCFLIFDFFFKKFIFLDGRR